MCHESIMKKLLIITIAMLMAGAPAASMGAGLSTVGGHAVEVSKSTKPASPITVTIDAPGPATAGPGDVVELEATVTSVSGGLLQVEFKLLGGVELLGGTLTREVKSQSGKPIVLPITVRVPQSGRGKVRVVARTVNGKGRRGFSGRAVYRFGPEPKKEPPLEPEIKPDGRGGSVIEYRLAP